MRKWTRSFTKKSRRISRKVDSNFPNFSSLSLYLDNFCKKTLDKQGILWYNRSTSAQQAFLLCPAPSERKGQHTLPEGGTHILAARRRVNQRLQEVPINMANDVRVKVTLVCTECKQRNYDTKKNKKNDPDRIELKKYCRFCRKHTAHKESK